jgi:cell division protein ZapE
MTPIDYYQEQVIKGVIFSDAEQLIVMQHLQRLYQELIEEQKKRSSFFSFLHPRKPPHGIYLWGGVGIGKTFMMDCFYHSLPFPHKLRMHFHQFMQMVHDKLTLHQGENDPLKVIAKEISQQTTVLCFDELFVSDITDAMLLGRLIKMLFLNGVCLVATSNIAPDDLYKNGLQRAQFLPAILALKKNMEIIHMPVVVDYRLRHLQQAGVFYTPLNKTTEQNMEKSFVALTKQKNISYSPVRINDRYIKIKKQTNEVVWFEFKDICSVPRSQHDYLAIAKLYQTVFVSNIPVIQENEKDMICLFISLVDVLYDARVRLVISAAEPIEQLYNRGYMLMEYARTHSRLLEMQSQDYFVSELNRDNT